MSNFEGAKEWAQMAFDRKKNRGVESASGAGSFNAVTGSAKKLITDTVKNNNIKRIVDLGCGDFNWMSTIRDEFSDVYYEGWDANEEMIVELNDQYGNDNTKFYMKDITEEKLSNFDLVICRDVLFHLEFANSLKVLRNIDEAQIPHLITSCFLDVTKNTNIVPCPDKISQQWGFYKINLNLEPFNMSDFLVESLEENIRNDGYVRSICLYSL